MWELDLSNDALRRIAETLGSDVPVCVESRSAWMEGRGERVTLAPGIAGAAMLLVNPGVAVPTGPVFKGLTARTGVGTVPHDVPLGDTPALAAFLKGTRNDLEAPAIALAPVIGEVLGELSRMPGSDAVAHERQRRDVLCAVRGTARSRDGGHRARALAPQVVGSGDADTQLTRSSIFTPSALARLRMADTLPGLFRLSISER